MSLAAAFPKPTLELERALLLEGKHHIAGVDEVGVGAIAGPLIAVAVALPLPDLGSDFEVRLKELADRLREVRDSHHLYKDQRERLFTLVQEVAQSQIGFGVIEVAELGQINNQEQAAILARTRAVDALSTTPDFALLDGKVRIESAIPYAQIPKVGHGTPSLTIAAASIIAGVTHQHLMQAQDKLYPQYGFVRHTGNISPKHLEALAQYGPSPIHHLHNRIVKDILGVV
ncbi:MAG TPA: ribonuclease HII [Chloroflexia bacterium]|nr:ribonuclease HII [Chloroflexia bacterium]